MAEWLKAPISYADITILNIYLTQTHHLLIIFITQDRYQNLTHKSLNVYLKKLKNSFQKFLSRLYL